MTWPVCVVCDGRHPGPTCPRCPTCGRTWHGYVDTGIVGYRRACPDPYHGAPVNVEDELRCR